MRVGLYEDKKASHDVKQEFLVKHQPTNSGEGYADYVLWDSDWITFSCY